MPSSVCLRIAVKTQTIKLNFSEVINKIELCTHLYSMSLATKFARRISTKSCSLTRRSPTHRDTSLVSQVKLD